MAAAMLSRPGSKYGPCEAGEYGCGHRNCRITQRMASEMCRFCSERIGYERRFYTDPQNARDVRGDGPETGPQLVHADCLEDYYARESDVEARI